VNLLSAALLGLGLGVVTGMPLGVVNVAIVDAASSGRQRFAIGVGLGGALADMLHAGLAFVGVGRLVTARPDLVRWLAIAAAVAIVLYAALAWRRRETPRVATDESRIGRGFATGFVLTLPNPGALAAWVTVAAALWPDASYGEAIAFAIGVGLGSAAWFALLARWISGIRPDHPALSIIPRAALVAFVGIAVVGVVRVM
jgi:threonine/homoserine/homoserine lactone efflux protein